jgi:hypothetical protein
MKKSILLAFILFAFISCREAPKPPVEDKENARVFVQKFYDWYTALYNAATPEKTAVVPAESVALNKKTELFDAPLYQAIIDDRTASAKVSDEIVGFDADPFLNAQDTGFTYLTGNVKQAGDKFYVDVHSDLAGKSEKDILAGEVAIIAEVSKVNGQWKFINFIYPSKHDQENLVDILKGLHKERVKQGYEKP